MSGTNLLILSVIYPDVGIYLISTGLYIHCYLVLSLQVITMKLTWPYRRGRMMWMNFILSKAALGSITFKKCFAYAHKKNYTIMLMDLLLCVLLSMKWDHIFWIPGSFLVCWTHWCLRWWFKLVLMYLGNQAYSALKPLAEKRRGLFQPAPLMRPINQQNEHGNFREPWDLISNILKGLPFLGFRLLGPWCSG